MDGEHGFAATVIIDYAHKSFCGRRLRPKTTRITWDKLTLDKNMILEAGTGDRLRLAYRIANALSSRSLNIVFAKVATEKQLALDISYITLT